MPAKVKSETRSANRCLAMTFKPGSKRPIRLNSTEENDRQT